MTYTEIEKYVIDNRKYYPKKLEQKDIVNFIYNFCTEQCQKRDELIKAQDEYIHLLLCSSYPENNVTTKDFRDSEAKIEQLKKEIQ